MPHPQSCVAYIWEIQNDPKRHGCGQVEQIEEVPQKPVGHRKHFIIMEIVCRFLGEEANLSLFLNRVALKLVN
jgi:hypothetical protein